MKHSIFNIMAVANSTLLSNCSNASFVKKDASITLKLPVIPGSIIREQDLSTIYDAIFSTHIPMT